MRGRGAIACGLLLWIARGAIACGLLLWIASAADAHPLAPALFEVRELSEARELGAVRELGDGEVEVRWKRSLLSPSGVDLLPELPEACATVGEPRGERDATSATLIWRARCPGLSGETLRVRGLEGSGIDVLVRVVLSDGRVVRAVLSDGDASTQIPERAEPLAMVADYAALGVGHILSGPDHLLFVLALVLLVRGRRRLVWTVTAFTVGHSITLSLAVLGFVRFPSGLVEVAIAASIFVLAVELARPEGSGLRGRPWLLAGGFGLLHGLGFAGALAQAGLPADEIPLALFAFNVGIEAGQLLFVLAVLVLRFGLRGATARAPIWLGRVPAYAIGSLAAYWSFERAARVLGVG